MKSVTHTSKCYIHACAACDLLFETTRPDQITCCPACRVAGHRSGTLKRLRALAKSNQLRPDMLCKVKAIQRLCPELEVQLRAGTLTIDDAMPSVCKKFAANLFKEIQP